MDLMKLMAFGLLYVLITGFSGRSCLEIFRINYKNEVLNILLGFLLIESFSFITFICFGLTGFKGFILSFIPNALFAAISLIYLFKSGFSFLSKDSFRVVLWKPSLFLFLTIIGLYFLEASELFFNVLNSSGVVYQDIIYHGGISRSMINFGYPVHDLQFNEKLWNYHFFTHFLAAKISFVSFNNVFVSYHIFLNFLGILCYSFLSVSLFQTIFSSKKYGFKYKCYEIIVGASGFFAFFFTFLLGGMLNSSFINAFFLSSSFQWQLIIILIFFLVIFNPGDNKALMSLKQIFILVMLLFISALIKVSSLPLIIAGIGSLIIYNLIFFNKQRLKIWTQLFFILLSFGILIFISFFNVGSSQSSTLEFNIDLLKLTPVINYFRIESLILSIIIYLISVISFRFMLIFKLRKIETWFAGSILLTGLILSLLVKDNQVYFIFPAIILSSHLAIIYFLKSKPKKVILFLFLFLLILSFYPVGSLGLTFKAKLEEKNDYYPLNVERLELYSWIRKNTEKNDVFFTTSQYSSPDMIADNYAPAAFSGRKTLLGGFRFGGVEYEDDFHKRLELTKNFNLRDEEIWDLLKKENIEFGLIEKSGNFDEMLFEKVKKDVNENLYRIIFKNSQGLIFQLIETNENEI